MVVAGDGRMDAVQRRLDKAAKGAIGRYLASPAFGKLKPGEAGELGWPAGLAAEGAVQIVRLPRRASVDEARKAGAAVGEAVWARPA